MFWIIIHIYDKYLYANFRCKNNISKTPIINNNNFFVIIDILKFNRTIRVIDMSNINFIFNLNIVD